VTPAVFLDRDGTLIDDVGYLDRLDQVALYPWTADALRLLRRAGFALVVITNQSGVARGFFSEAFVGDVHAHLAAELARGGASIDAWFHCPHHDDADDPAYRLDCDCRKPRPGLLRQAEKELGADLAQSWMIGDRHGDLAVAWAAGARAALVKTGYGQGELAWHAERWPRPPDLVAENVLEAVERILALSEDAA
jgi:D-glycero-D-manno-heptose 1,7-bisphosphate phosphatase